MVAVATCRYCEAGVPHEVCAESVTTAAETNEVPHIHHFQAEVTLDDPAFSFRDCACGYRERVKREGLSTVILEDGIVAGGSSVDNAAFVYKPELNTRAGVSWFDRWSL